VGPRQQHERDAFAKDSAAEAVRSAMIEHDAPQAPTDDWPGGWVIRLPGGRTGKPAGNFAWRLEDDAIRQCRPLSGGRVEWVAVGYSAAGMPTALDRAFWSSVWAGTQRRQEEATSLTADERCDPCSPRPASTTLS
jgi:hypothetical protein